LVGFGKADADSVDCGARSVLLIDEGMAIFVMQRAWCIATCTPRAGPMYGVFLRYDWDTPYGIGLRCSRMLLLK